MANPIDSEWETVSGNDSEWEDVPTQESSIQQPSLTSAAIKDVGDIAQSIPQAASIGKRLVSAPLFAMKSGAQMATGTPFSETRTGQDLALAGQVAKGIPVGLFNRAKELGVGQLATGHPIKAGRQLKKAFFEKPVSTALDVAAAANAAAPIFRAIRGPEALAAISRVTVEPASKVVGEALASGVEKITGIPKKNVSDLFSKPSELFTAPTKKIVSKAYAASELPDSPQGLDDIIQKATSSYNSYVKRGANALKEGIENPRIFLDARKALDKQLALLQNQIDVAKAGSRSALIEARNSKLALRQAFNSVLDRIAPKLRAADAMASRQLTVDPFRRISLPGKIHFVSTEGLLRAIPGLPPLIGAGISGAGGTVKGVKSILGGASRSVIPAAISSEISAPTGKIIDAMPKRKILEDPKASGVALGLGAAKMLADRVLTEEKAKEFLKKAKGDRNKARQLAREANYTWDGME